MILSITYRITSDQRNRKRTVICCPAAPKHHGTIHANIDKAKVYAKKNLGKNRGEIVIERPSYVLK